jgi:hypothetical protein
LHQFVHTMSSPLPEEMPDVQVGLLSHRCNLLAPSAV